MLGLGPGGIVAFMGGGALQVMSGAPPTLLDRLLLGQTLGAVRRRLNGKLLALSPYLYPSEQHADPVLTNES
ncbi:hypothetical protein RQ846_18945 [Roseomonas mucosa]|uniref:hypothetical protein n=1 Tax=Roseomonas mucosa TaxID=207340 RepID=UPI0028CD38B2|nr:hypothetical protein [Roseomonas mucosa]MDT8291794.1 hypothetical protein [Roseomonas mucosa]